MLRSFFFCNKPYRLSSTNLFKLGRRMGSSVKPPNVLVYTGKSYSGVFEKASDQLRTVLHPDKYVIYEMTESQVMVQPWRENIALLMVLCGSLEDSIAELFRNYLANGGKLIVCCSDFNMPEIGLSCAPATERTVDVLFGGNLKARMTRGKFSYNLSNAEILANDTEGEPVIMKASCCNQGVLVVSAVHLEEPHEKQNYSQLLESTLGTYLNLEVCSTDIPQPTPGFILSRNGRNPNLNINEVSLEKGPSSAKVPLLMDSGDTSQFDKQKYFQNLKAKRFGEVTVFFPVTSTTMIIAEQFSNSDNIVAVAGRQISGMGRGGNKWISPEGCAMFTLHFTMNLTSQLGQRLSVLQHLASLAVVLGIRKLHGFQNLDLRLKWPNDLYHGSQEKIGGVLVNSTIQGNLVHSYIGIGVNTSNRRPTTCINSIIQSFNEATGSTLPELAKEIVIARTLSELELLVDDFMSFGADNFLSLYYQYWLHADQTITLASLGKEATIKRLDEYGYLVVETANGERLTLQPDGNRFDMMQNLIVSK